MPPSPRDDAVPVPPRPTVRGSPGEAVAVVATAVLMALVPGRLTAQDAVPTGGEVAVEARGSAAFPVGRSSLDAVTRIGPAFGGGVSVHLSRLFALTASADYHLLQEDGDEAGTPVPDLNVLSVTGGVELNFRESGNPWTGGLSLGAGISALDTKETLGDGTPAPLALDITALTVRGGLKLGYLVTPSVAFYVEPSVYMMAMDRDLTEPYAVVAPALDEPFDIGWIVPLQAGIRAQL